MAIAWSSDFALTAASRRLSWRPRHSPPSDSSKSMFACSRFTRRLASLRSTSPGSRSFRSAPGKSLHGQRYEAISCPVPRRGPEAIARLRNSGKGNNPIASRLLGDSSTVEHRTLTPRILVRIQVPQPHHRSHLFAHGRHRPQAPEIPVRTFRERLWGAANALLQPGNLTVSMTVHFALFVRRGTWRYRHDADRHSHPQFQA